MALVQHNAHSPQDAEVMGHIHNVNVQQFRQLADVFRPRAQVVDHPQPIHLANGAEQLGAALRLQGFAHRNISCDSTVPEDGNHAGLRLRVAAANRALIDRWAGHRASDGD
jgi:hypothetical protein